MQRSSSWPQLTYHEQENDGGGYRSELIRDLLQENMSSFKRQSNARDAQLQLLEEDQKHLRMQNADLLRKNRYYAQEVLILEGEKDEFKIRVQEEQSNLADLQKELRQIKRENKKISTDLTILRKELIDTENSNKELEKQLVMFREALKQQRSEIEETVIHKAVNESAFLKQQLQTLEQQLDKKDIKEVELLRIENKEIQTQICELVQENVALTRELGEMQQCIER